MASHSHIVTARKPERAGLAHYMARVLKERERAAKDLDPEAVHDLRVALRRCRTMADALSTFDPDKSLRAMRRASKRTFRSLGQLRDAQVLREWVKKIAALGDPLASKLLQALTQTEAAAKVEAEAALGEFDVHKWRRWSRELGQRSQRVALDSLAFQHLALERCTEAYEAHRAATRSRSRVGWHRVRIALKRFRYTVENFLPSRHEGWIADLKLVQDLLGEVHDLDVLRGEFMKIDAGAKSPELEQWLARLDALRSERLAAYRVKARGQNSIWKIWFEGLPSGERVEEAVFAALDTWASFRDPNLDHSRKVTALALELFDGLGDKLIHPVFREAVSRRILHAAALLHDVGRARKDSNHHKRSFRMISAMAPPMGWSKDEMASVALIARYHRGAEPRQEQKEYAALAPGEQERVAWLAATLRLADGLDFDHRGRILSISVVRDGSALTIRAVGYVHDVDSAETLARKKHLLETLCECPVIIQAAETMPAAKITSIAS